MHAADALGWLAAVIFAGSYFCRRPEAVRRVQMLGALMWVGYGVSMRALPVVAANLLVLLAAAWAGRRRAPAAMVAPADR